MPIYFIPQASKCPTLDPLVLQRGTQDAAKRKPQGSTSRARTALQTTELISIAASRSREKITPSTPNPSPARLLPALSSPTRPIMVPDCLHRPIGALLERWAGRWQPLPDEPPDTTRWKARGGGESNLDERFEGRDAGNAYGEPQHGSETPQLHPHPHPGQVGLGACSGLCCSAAQRRLRVAVVIPPPRSGFLAFKAKT